MRDFLKQARQNKGYTQKEIAEKVGISERHYQYLEAGQRVGSLKVIKDISKLLDVDMNLF